MALLLEVKRMSVPPVRRHLRDADTPMGRGEQPPAQSDAVVRASLTGAVGGADSAGPDASSTSPAAPTSWESRIASSALRQARTEAEQAAANLDQVVNA